MAWSLPRRLGPVDHRNSPVSAFLPFLPLSYVSSEIKVFVQAAPYLLSCIYAKTNTFIFWKIQKLIQNLVYSEQKVFWCGHVCWVVWHIVWRNMLCGVVCCVPWNVVWCDKLCVMACCMVRHVVWHGMSCGLMLVRPWDIYTLCLLSLHASETQRLRSESRVGYKLHHLYSHVM